MSLQGKARRVTFVLRSDNDSKFGGDTLQVQEYAKRLSARGWHVQTVEFHASMRLEDPGVVHLVNIDRVYDFMVAFAAAKRFPVFVSTIHHARSRIYRMRASVRPASTAIRVANLLPEAVRELVGYAYRDLRKEGSRRGLIRFRRFMGLLPWTVRPWRRIGKLLDQCSAVFLLAQGEGEDLRRDTGWQAANWTLVPNAVDPGENRGKEWAKRLGLIAVGRVEPRKRVLELAEAAEAAGIPLRVVGALGVTDPGYSKKFVELCARARHVDYAGPRSHSETLAEIAAARVLVNASFVEVQSLVELEAAMMGARVVGCPSGNTGDWLSTPHYEATDDFSISTLLARARDAMHGDGPGELAPETYPWTWDRSVDELEFNYLRALES